MRKRKGFTLIEVSVVMALLGIVMLVAGSILYAVIELESAENNLSQRNLGIMEMGRLFRQDVARAAVAKASRVESRTSLEITLSDKSRVSYQFDGKQLLRESGTGSQRLLRSSSLQDVQFTESSEGRLIAVRVTEKGRLARSPLRSFFYQSALGSDLR